MRILRTIARHLFSKWTIRTAGAILVSVAVFYKYEFEMRPVVEMTAPDPVQVQHKVETFKFNIRVHYRNAGRSTAVGVKACHVFFAYPPAFKDLVETDIPDLLPSGNQVFTLVKYLHTDTLSASINFFSYQNLFVITAWGSNNLSHFHRLFFQAQWYRLYLHMQEDRQLGSYLVLVKSRYYTLWDLQGEEAYREILRQFVEGETLTGAYNLEELDWSRGKD